MNKIVRLGDICDLKNGFAFKSNDYVEKSNTLNIRMSNIRPDGNFDEMHKARYLPDSFSEKYKEFLLKDNDLIPLIKENINLIKELDVSIEINFDSNKSETR